MRPRSRFRALSALLLGALAACLPALSAPPAQARMQGPFSRASIAGREMACRYSDGRIVRVFTDDNLRSAAVAWHGGGIEPAIILNPRRFAGFPDVVGRWAFAHECAHLLLPRALNTEDNADCLGIKLLIRHGFLRDPRELDAFADALRHWRASARGHSAGPMRAERIRHCAHN